MKYVATYNDKSVSLVSVVQEEEIEINYEGKQTYLCLERLSDDGVILNVQSIIQQEHTHNIKFKMSEHTYDQLFRLMKKFNISTVKTIKENK